MNGLVGVVTTAQPPTPRVRRAMWAMGVAVFVAHLAIGVYYWSQWVVAHATPPRPPLQLVGEEYLATFPGWRGAGERDSAAYNAVALNILEQGRPVTRDGDLYLRAPVYPYFLAFSYRLGGVRF